MRLNRRFCEITIAAVAIVGFSFGLTLKAIDASASQPKPKVTIEDTRKLAKDALDQLKSRKPVSVIDLIPGKRINEFTDWTLARIG